MPTSGLLLSVFAGNANGAGNIDGTGAAASFSYPSSVATDASGNVYVVDKSNNTIRMITREGVVTTLAGTAGVGGFQPGALPGVIYSPNAIAVSGSKIYFSSNNGIVVIK